MYRNPRVRPYIADRLRNEAAVLKFLAEHTTIPVPKFLGLEEQHGLVYLKTSFIGDGIELQNVEASKLPTAMAKVTAQLEENILPQLASSTFRSCASFQPSGVMSPNKLSIK
jgi:hypothetical protein